MEKKAVSSITILGDAITYQWSLQLNFEDNTILDVDYIESYVDGNFSQPFEVRLYDEDGNDYSQDTEMIQMIENAIKEYNKLQKEM